MVVNVSICSKAILQSIILVVNLVIEKYKLLKLTLDNNIVLEQYFA